MPRGLTLVMIATTRAPIRCVCQFAWPWYHSSTKVTWVVSNTFGVGIAVSLASLVSQVRKIVLGKIEVVI